MRTAALIAAAVLMLASVGCAPATNRITQADDGETVTLRVGDTLVVELPGNPTTGFSWSGAADPEVVVLTGEPEFESDSDLIGAGGTVTMTYEAVKPGDGTLRLNYSRVWESVQPEDTFSVKVNVTE